jgi:RNA polymerase-binding transcription factor DksA
VAQTAPDVPEAMPAAPVQRPARKAPSRASTTQTTPTAAGDAATPQVTDTEVTAGPGAPASGTATTGASTTTTATTRATRRNPAKDAGTQGTPPAQAPARAQAPVPAWSDEELAGFRAALDADIVRLREELDMGEADLAGLIEDSGDGAGDDQADAGSKTFEREHEMSVNANTREMLDQALRALRRLDAGTYGSCEACGGPIAAGRLRAFPRATLCIACKQAEERR